MYNTTSENREMTNGNNTRTRKITTTLRTVHLYLIIDYVTFHIDVKLSREMVYGK